MPGGFEPDHFVKKWNEILDGGTGVILASFKENTITGAIGAVLTQHLFSSKMMAVECFWYVLPEHRGDGIRLLKAFEEWAVKAGAELLAMIHLLSLQPEKLGSLYRRMGYHPVEVNYLKEIQ